MGDIWTLACNNNARSKSMQANWCWGLLNLVVITQWWRVQVLEQANLKYHLNFLIYDGIMIMLLPKGLLGWNELMDAEWVNAVVDVNKY